jgi:hypothetical protein
MFPAKASSITSGDRPALIGSGICANHPYSSTTMIDKLHLRKFKSLGEIAGRSRSRPLSAPLRLNRDKILMI